MFDHILVPLDGSDQSEQIGRWAGGLAKGLGASITLLGVPSSNGNQSDQAMVDAKESESYLTNVANKINETGVEANIEVVAGKPSEVIVKTAERLDVDIIAVATRRVSSLARSVLGSVTDTVLHNTATPVLIANPDALIVSESSPDVPASLIVPLDGSSLSERVIPTAVEFAKACGAEVVFLRVLQRAFSGSNDPATKELHKQCVEYLDAHVKSATEQGAKARSVATSGVPAAEIMKQADEEEGSIVVMATHGYTGFRRAVLGSVCDTIVRSSRTPVLVLPSA